MKQSIQSIGGEARAAKLSRKQRSLIAQRAAEARWANREDGEFPQATHDGVLDLGGFKIECANLPDGSRVLSRGGFARAIGRTGRIQGGQAYIPESQLPIFVGASNLSPFITNDLLDNCKEQIFRTTRGALAIGYKAELLTEVCGLFLKADAERALRANQKHILNRCRVLLQGFASVGINALVDEATGYQYDRARDALARILEKFIAKELRPWTRTFPIEFYEGIFRLNGWKFDPATMQGPRVLGRYTDDIVYRRLAPGVRAELRKKNPVIDGRRKHKHHQWLTGEIGHPKLLAHLEGVKILMAESETWDQFITKLNRYYPIRETAELGFEIEIARRNRTQLLASRLLPAPTSWDQPS
jgi:hypothetical protein